MGFVDRLLFIRYSLKLADFISSRWYARDGVDHSRGSEALVPKIEDKQGLVLIQPFGNL